MNQELKSDRGLGLGGGGRGGGGLYNQEVTVLTDTILNINKDVFLKLYISKRIKGIVVNPPTIFLAQFSKR